MENTVFERNYEIVEKDDRATAVFERAFAPGIIPTRKTI